MTVYKVQQLRDAIEFGRQGGAVGERQQLLPVLEELLETLETLRGTLDRNADISSKAFEICAELHTRALPRGRRRRE